MEDQVYVKIINELGYNDKYTNFETFSTIANNLHGLRIKNCTGVWAPLNNSVFIIALYQNKDGYVKLRCVDSILTESMENVIGNDEYTEYDEVMLSNLTCKIKRSMFNDKKCLILLIPIQEIVECIKPHGRDEKESIEGNPELIEEYKKMIYMLGSNPLNGFQLYENKDRGIVGLQLYKYALFQLDDTPFVLTGDQDMAGYIRLVNHGWDAYNQLAYPLSTMDNVFTIDGIRMKYKFVTSGALGMESCETSIYLSIDDIIGKSVKLENLALSPVVEIPKDEKKEDEEMSEEVKVATNNVITFDMYDKFDYALLLLQELTAMEEGIQYIPSRFMVIFDKLTEMVGYPIGFLIDRYTPGNNLLRLYTDLDRDIQSLKAHNITYHTHLHKLGKYCAGGGFNKDKDIFHITIDIGYVIRKQYEEK